jgi:septum formation protein
MPLSPAIPPAELILASASPRRRQLLGDAGIAFRVIPSSVPEVPEPGEAAAVFAARVATAKARAVASAHPDAWVLGADTVVTIGGAILGKPADAAGAAIMLRRLSGEDHTVLTAVSLVAPSGTIEAITVATAIRFRGLSDAEIQRYAASGEPLDKAGAYAIQGGARGFVAALDGSYTNVVGLPLDEVLVLLQGHGLLAQPGTQ